MDAQKFNAWRIAPRLMVLMYIYMFYEVMNWFMGVPAPSNAQAAFVSTFTLTGPAIFKFYVDTGNSE